MTMREGSGEEKLYLDVPFPDKEQVKALGARWDRDARSWYVPNHLDVESFTHWLALLPADDAWPSTYAVTAASVSGVTCSRSAPDGAG
jgi:Domain of unknown function (DUF5710)